MIIYLVWHKSIREYKISEADMKKSIHVAMAYLASRCCEEDPRCWNRLGRQPCLDGQIYPLTTSESYKQAVL